MFFVDVVVVETTYIRAAENAGVALQITLVELAAVPGVGEVQLSLCHVLWGAGVVVVVDGYLGGHHHRALEGETLKFSSVYFSSRWYLCARKSPYICSIPSLASFPPTLKRVC